MTSKTSPIRITVTGAAGQIGYSLLPRIASGELFGPNQPVRLQLLEVPQAMKALEGVAMELQDCAFPTLAAVDITDDPARAFDRTQWALLVGARPRGQGMERKDLLTVNAPIFTAQGNAINAHAGKDVRIVVVGNPANTNALIACNHAPDVPVERFSALTRLDHNRAVSFLAKAAHADPAAVKRMSIWGNHSATMVVDASQVTITGTVLRHSGEPQRVQNRNNSLRDPGQARMTTLSAFNEQEFVSTIRNRGAVIIEKRGLSSALSAANAIIDHVRCWQFGTAADDWTSMAVWSHGDYGAPKDVIFSFPCTCTNGSWQIVPNLSLSPEVKNDIHTTGKELEEERTTVQAMTEAR